MMKRWSILMTLAVFLLNGCGENSNRYLAKDYNIGIYHKSNTLIFQKESVTLESKITGIYIAYFQRAADKAGLDYWVNQANEEIKSGGDISTIYRKISSGFASQEMFQRTYRSLDNQSFVENIYQNVSAQYGDQQGIEYWTKKLDEGLSRSDMLAGFVEALMMDNLNDAQFAYLSEEELTIAQKRQNYLLNKVGVALHFTNLLGELTNVQTTPIELDRPYLASKKILVDVNEEELQASSVIGFLNLIQNDYDPIERILGSNQQIIAIDSQCSTTEEAESINDYITLFSGDIVQKINENTSVKIYHNENQEKKVCVSVGSAYVLRYME